MDGKPWRIELLSAIRARYRDGEWLPLSYQKLVALLLYLGLFFKIRHDAESLREDIQKQSAAAGPGTRSGSHFPIFLC